MPSTKLLTSMLAVTALSWSACKKDKKTNDPGATVVTDANENTIFSTDVATGSLAITTLDVLGVNSTDSGGSLRLQTDEFSTDQGRFRVNDAAMEALNQAAGILCFFNQASYIDMADQGDYLAQVDDSTCFSEGESGDNQSSGSSKNLITITVNSSRESTRHPLIVKAWFTMEEMEMQVKMVITEGQSSTNPIGIFRLTWEGQFEGQTGMKGFIESKRSTEEGKIILNMAESSEREGKNFNVKSSAVLNYDAAAEDVTGGVLAAEVPEWNQEAQEEKTKEFLAGFNNTHFWRNDILKDSQACLDLNAFDYSVWRYGLYSAADGSRVSRNSGFPIVYDTAEGKREYGWAGYWGVWLNTEVTNGMTLKKINHETGETQEFTAKVAPGKLIKRTKQSIPLTDLAGVEMGIWQNGQELLVEYEASTGKFKKVGTRDNQGNMTSATGYYAVDTSHFGNDAPSVIGVNFWARSLGGPVIVNVNTSTGVASGTSGFYYQEENVTASAGNLTLYCYQNCLKGNITDSNNSTYQPDYSGVTDWSDSSQIIAATERSYTFDGANMVLKDGSNAVKFADNVQFESWGVQSGPLVTTRPADPFRIWEANEYYFWETGKQAWNKYIGLVDSQGTIPSFDPPLFITYTHTKEKDRSGSDELAKFYDKKYLFEYNGFGQLHGIPASPDETGRWTPAFALADGALVGASDEYKVKALDGELRMKEVDAAQCADLASATKPELPSIDSWVSPALGDAPSLEGVAPAVVEGVVQ